MSNYFKKIFLISLTSHAVMAGTIGEVMQPLPNQGSFVGSLSMGPAWPDHGRSQTLFLTPAIEKRYQALHSTRAIFDGELFLGGQRSLSSSLLGQFGLAFARSSYAGFSGSIWDDGEPEFNNYNYRYRVAHTHAALKAKVLSTQFSLLMPWISASVGLGVNEARGYSNTPRVCEAVHNPDFDDHAQAAFTYTLGVGVQRTIHANWQVGVGYEFSDWGKSHLGAADGQTLHQYLTMNHLQTNGVLFNITYVS